MKGPMGLLLLDKALGKKGKGKENGGDMDMSKEAEVDAASQMIAAMKSGDAEAFSQALKDHYEACGLTGADYEE